MKVVCAWCQRDGEPGYLGGGEPSEDPATTHGICSRHRERVLEALPSRPFRDSHMLIVSRTKPGTHAYMKPVSESEDVVLFDRREGDRRRIRRRVTSERRRGERRRRDVMTDLQKSGWAVVRRRVGRRAEELL